MARDGGGVGCEGKSHDNGSAILESDVDATNCVCQVCGKHNIKNEVGMLMFTFLFFVHILIGILGH